MVTLTDDEVLSAIRTQKANKMHKEVEKQAKRIDCKQKRKK